MLDAVPDVFFILDDHGEFVRWNDRLEPVTGRDTMAIVESGTLELIDPPARERVSAAVRRVLVDGETRSVEVGLVSPDDPTPYELSIAPLRTPDGEVGGAIGIGRDVTNRRRRRQLAAQNERLERFASIVSHDLRNPLSVAEGFLGIERETHDSENLGRVAAALGQMDALVEDLLALARQGKVVDEPVPVDLRRVAIDAWESVDASNGTFHPPERVQLLADADRFRELFENLYRNSIEHGTTSMNGASRVVVTVEATEDGFRVYDDGPGLSSEEREQAFEYGFTTADRGTGFGLAIVEEIAEAHGWQVSIGEGPTGGACLVVTGVERA
ncbi:sensor histidine kinase [Halosegnis sp.]|uniref:sensor histidine kinase n=1 Tax=Halosegnis sp. TaxID=2864959 RepID=UPI0035D4D38A